MKNRLIVENNSILSCPICKNQLDLVDGKSLICSNKHCYDIAKQGYINFVHSSKDFYSQSLFFSRRNIFEKGFYENVTNELNRLIKKYVCSGIVLDVGCGEGYYLKSILKNEDFTKIGFDISKQAIKLAAKGEKEELLFVADLENIPLKDSSIDMILNILTPANYNEFNRILHENGYLIKIIPGENYLKELRDISKEYLKNETHSNTKVIDLFKNNLNLLEQVRVCYTLPMNFEDAKDFSNMTPMLTNVDIEKLKLDKLRSITIDLEILIGKF